MEYHKKIDKSFFKYGFTVPKKYIDGFLFGQNISTGKSRDVILEWKGKKFEAKICRVNRKAGEVYQLRWDGNSDFKKEIKKEFIQSYIAIESQNYTAKKNNKYYVTSLSGGNQEVMVFESLSPSVIRVTTFIKIDTAYNELFKELISENVFGWLSLEKNNQMITHESPWLDISDLRKHQDKVYVVYYLVDEGKKNIYIGSAQRLGDRVKPERNEIPEWNKFRYEIIHPKFHEQLKQIEYHSIMNFAKFFENKGGLSTLGISDYILVNKDYKFYLK